MYFCQLLVSNACCSQALETWFCSFLLIVNCVYNIDLYDSGAGSFGVFSCVLDGVERQQSHRAVYRLTHINIHKLIVEMWE